MSIFLSPLKISLQHSFHCFIKMPERKRDRAHVFQKLEASAELIQQPRPWKAVIQSIIYLWKNKNTKYTTKKNQFDAFFKGSCICKTPPSPIHTHTLGLTCGRPTVWVHTKFLIESTRGELPLGLTLVRICVKAWIRGNLSPTGDKKESNYLFLSVSRLLATTSKQPPPFHSIRAASPIITFHMPRAHRHTHTHKSSESPKCQKMPLIFITRHKKRQNTRNLCHF